MRENLVKHNWQGLDSCVTCCNYQETVDHLIIQCPYTRVVWKYWIDRLRLNGLPVQLNRYDPTGENLGSLMHQSPSGTLQQLQYVGSFGENEVTESLITSPSKLIY